MQKAGFLMTLFISVSNFPNQDKILTDTIPQYVFTRTALIMSVQILLCCDVKKVYGPENIVSYSLSSSFRSEKCQVSNDQEL